MMINKKIKIYNNNKIFMIINNKSQKIKIKFTVIINKIIMKIHYNNNNKIIKMNHKINYNL